MISKNRIKFINSLKYGKFRKKYGLFIAEGPKITGELLNSNFKIDSIYATGGWLRDNKRNVSHLQVFEVTDNELKKISSLTTPNQVLTVASIPRTDIPENGFERELVLVLDGINDPGNLGTIIRTADWFGIKNIICSENTVDLYNPKVIQSTMGSFARVKTFYTSLTDFFEKHSGNAGITGTFLKGENIYETPLPRTGFVVIGSEAKGISREVEKYTGLKISIPPSKGDSGSAESLNASVATGIVLSEFVRRMK